MAKALNIPKDIVGSIVCKFKVKRTVVTLPGPAENGNYQRMQPDLN